MPNPDTGSLSASPRAVAITPSDTVVFAEPFRQLRCKPVSGAAGTLTVKTLSGEIFATEIAVGEKLDLIVTMVFTTGTTATGLEGFI